MIINMLDYEATPRIGSLRKASEEVPARGASHAPWSVARCSVERSPMLRGV